MNSYLLKIALIFLVLFIIPSQLKTGKCWESIPGKGDSRLRLTKIYGVNRCRSYCFDIHNVKNGGGCTIITSFIWAGWWYCYIATSALEKNLQNLWKHKAKSTQVMKKDCQDLNCWLKSQNQSLSLYKVDALDEKQCKFICLETNGCWHQAYQNKQCFIQFENTPLKSHSPPTDIGQIDELKESLCKSVKCWTRHHEWDISWTTLHSIWVDTEFDCRLRCYETYECRVFSWTYTHTCSIMTTKVARPLNHTGKAQIRMTSYELKSECFY